MYKEWIERENTVQLFCNWKSCILKDSDVFLFGKVLGQPLMTKINTSTEKNAYL